MDGVLEIVPQQIPPIELGTAVFDNGNDSINDKAIVNEIGHTFKVKVVSLDNAGVKVTGPGNKDFLVLHTGFQKYTPDKLCISTGFEVNEEGFLVVLLTGHHQKIELYVIIITIIDAICYIHYQHRQFLNCRTFAVKGFEFYFMLGFT
jgi:hypothetical protein